VESEHLVQVVQACKELAFERYLWTFPIVGALPYKGFFYEAQARKEAERVRALGYDVIVRPSDAFSSLGFLADPLFSFMKSYNEYDVAELVIHEMTHATIFLRGKKTGAFNEELATFVGRQGALDFVARRHGSDSGVYAAALRSRIDARTFATYLRGTAELLDAVYRSAEPESVKRSEKARIIAARATRYRVLGSQLYPDESSTGWRSYPMDKVDNALLDLYRLYEGEPELYERCWREACGSDLGAFIRLLKSSKDPAAVIAGYRRP
jgi:predicted aminopeptidase